MDSNDQERERGITILAKAASVVWRGTRINLVDTPGHADFGGEVERALAMVDGVLLLVDAAEGPLPQTRYVLSKALAAGLPAVRRAQQGRPPRRPARRGAHEVEELFLDLDAADRAARVPDHLGRRPRGPGDARASACPAPTTTSPPLLDAIVEPIPASGGDPDAPLQALVTNLDASDYLGRLAIGRVVEGTLREGDTVALLDEEIDEGQPPLTRRLTQLLGFEGVDRVEVEPSAGPATCS